MKLTNPTCEIEGWKLLRKTTGQIVSEENFGELVKIGTKIFVFKSTKKQIKNFEGFLPKPLQISIKKYVNFFGQVQIFWEGHKILWNLHLTFVLCSASQE